MSLSELGDGCALLAATAVDDASAAQRRRQLNLRAEAAVATDECLNPGDDVGDDDPDHDLVVALDDFASLGRFANKRLPALRPSDRLPRISWSSRQPLVAMAPSHPAQARRKAA